MYVETMAHFLQLFIIDFENNRIFVRFSQLTDLKTRKRETFVKPGFRLIYYFANYDGFVNKGIVVIGDEKTLKIYLHMLYIAADVICTLLMHSETRMSRGWTPLSNWEPYKNQGVLRVFPLAKKGEKMSRSY